MFIAVDAFSRGLFYYAKSLFGLFFGNEALYIVHVCVLYTVYCMSSLACVCVRVNPPSETQLSGLSALSAPLSPSLYRTSEKRGGWVRGRYCTVL